MQAGLSRQIIPSRQRQIGMMGYGKPENQVLEAHSDLYVRSLVLRSDTGQRLIFSNAEICFVTQAVQQEVLRRLQQVWPDLQEAELLLSAQHTHSGPGGYSHYAFYNMTVPGFQPAVFEAIVKSFVSSILAAERALAPARLAFAAAPFAEHLDVAFNRSLPAYNQNPENTPLRPEQTHLAIDRNMYLLRISSPTGQLRGIVNWFGVHATSLSARNTGVSSDNKGYAAQWLEDHLQQQGHKAICIFAQGAAGDVSPNFHGSGKHWPRGKFSDDYESMRYNGRLQAEQALRILNEAAFEPLENTLDCRLHYADLSHLPCAPRFVNGQSDCRSAPAAQGTAFLGGTPVDGPGISPALQGLVAGFSRWQRRRYLRQLQASDPARWQQEREDQQMQAPKILAVESGRRRFLGLSQPEQLPVPAAADPVLGELKRLCQKGAMREHSWTPQILPLQIVRIGSLALIAFPGEATTTAARRLCQSVQNDLAAAGIRQSVFCGYSNAYFGYATTPEEYLLQRYEGGHTVFGRWTLPAFQTAYTEVAAALRTAPAQRPQPPNLRPPVFSEQELALRTGGSWR
ncbi:MAG: neutral/alkaline non-lysosomal ceramidase N-terminal domain-containing protein [Candidatus Sericytochromatia bacterium]|nr:neutral/alkaline non-lysosomal ceramidase N-terminal domain-containing protein [Candidatus Sericytochromatia bacterium]